MQSEMTSSVYLGRLGFCDNILSIFSLPSNSHAGTRRGWKHNLINFLTMID